MIPHNSNRENRASSSSNPLQMDRYSNSNNRDSTGSNTNLDQFSSHFPEAFSNISFEPNQSDSSFPDTKFSGEASMFDSDLSACSRPRPLNNHRTNPSSVEMPVLASSDFSLSESGNVLSQSILSNRPSDRLRSNSNFSADLSSLGQSSVIGGATDSSLNANVRNISGLRDLDKLDNATGTLNSLSVDEILTTTNPNLKFAAKQFPQEPLRAERQENPIQQQSLAPQINYSKEKQLNTYNNNQKHNFEEICASDIDLQVANIFLQQHFQSQAQFRPRPSALFNKNSNVDENNIFPSDLDNAGNRNSSTLQVSSRSAHTNNSNSTRTPVEGDDQVSLTDTLLLPPSSDGINSDASSPLSHCFPNSFDTEGISQKNHILNRARPKSISDLPIKNLASSHPGKIRKSNPDIWGMYDDRLETDTTIHNRMIPSQGTFENFAQDLPDDSVNNNFQESVPNGRSQYIPHQQSNFPSEPSFSFICFPSEISQPKPPIPNLSSDQQLGKDQQCTHDRPGSNDNPVQFPLFNNSSRTDKESNNQTLNERYFSNKPKKYQKVNLSGHRSLVDVQKLNSYDQNEQHQNQQDQNNVHNKLTFSNQQVNKNQSLQINTCDSHMSLPNNSISPSNTTDFVQRPSSSHGLKSNGNTSGHNSGTASHIISSRPLASPSFGNSHHQNTIPGSHDGSQCAYFSPPIAPHEAELMIIRQKYKTKSSIPSDMNVNTYAQQCIYAARSSRLSPFSLHPGEYNLLRPYIPVVHVTVYLNIRNGILRLWLSNPKVNVTRSEAAGCAKDDRFFNLAEVAYDWLVRNGYINFGCFEYPSINYYNPIPKEKRKPRQTVVILGAGVAGLSCARQLDNLFQRKARHFAEYQDLPKIVVLEGRRRIGGRVYTARLKSNNSKAVDMGAQFIMGFGNGNPLAVVCRRQLGLPVTQVEQNQFHTLTNDYTHNDPNSLSPDNTVRFQSIIYDSQTGQLVEPNICYRAHALFQQLLERVSQFRNSIPPPMTVYGDEVLVKHSKDPSSEEFPGILTIAKAEDTGRLKHKGILSDSDFTENGSNSHDHSHYYHSHGYCHTDYQKDNFGKIEAQFLKDIGFKLKPGVSKNFSIDLIPEPQGDMYPSLGISMDALLRQLQNIAYIAPEDLRVVNWYYANLESSYATCLDNLSLSNWKHETSETTPEGSDAIDSDDEMHVDRDADLYTGDLYNSQKPSSYHSSNFTGASSIINNGYINLARGLYLYPEKLDVRFKSNVKIIEYSNPKSSDNGSSNFSYISGMPAKENRTGKIEVILENGEKLKADKVVVTAPLGVLKDRAIQFIPDLPQWKQDSIKRLGFGVVNKVYFFITLKILKTNG